MDALGDRFIEFIASWYSGNPRRIIPPDLFFREKDMSAAEYKTPSLITPLSKRLRHWLAEIQPGQPEAEILPSLEEDLDYALKLTGKAGIQPELVIFLIASCSWWFRVFYAKEPDLKKALERQLSTVGYTPHFPRSFYRMTILDRYVSKQLSKPWPRDQSLYGEASRDINTAYQSKYLEEIVSLAKEWSGPVLVSECIQLPSRPGGYTKWGPWVAAVVVHVLAVRRRRSKKDSLPLECAEAILKALRDTDPP